MLFVFFLIWQAELRAAVFLALEEQEKVEVREPRKKKLKISILIVLHVELNIIALILCL